MKKRSRKQRISSAGKSIFLRCSGDQRFEELVREYMVSMDEVLLPEIFELGKIELQLFRLRLGKRRVQLSDTEIEASLLEYLDTIEIGSVHAVKPCEGLHKTAYQNIIRFPKAEDPEDGPSSWVDTDPIETQSALSEALRGQQQDIRTAVLLGLRFPNRRPQINKLLAPERAIRAKLILYRLSKEIGLPVTKVPIPVRLTSLSTGMSLAALESLDPGIALLFLMLADAGQFATFLSLMQDQTIHIPSAKEIQKILKKVLDLDKRLQGNQSISLESIVEMKKLAEDGKVFDRYLRLSISSSLAALEQMTEALKNNHSIDVDALLTVYSRVSKDLNAQIKLTALMN